MNKVKRFRSVHTSHRASWKAPLVIKRRGLENIWKIAVRELRAVKGNLSVYPNQDEYLYARKIFDAIVSGNYSFLHRANRVFATSFLKRAEMLTEEDVESQEGKKDSPEVPADDAEFVDPEKGDASPPKEMPKLTAKEEDDKEKEDKEKKDKEKEDKEKKDKEKEAEKEEDKEKEDKEKEEKEKEDKEKEDKEKEAEKEDKEDKEKEDKEKEDKEKEDKEKEDKEKEDKESSIDEMVDYVNNVLNLVENPIEGEGAVQAGVDDYQLQSECANYDPYEMDGLTTKPPDFITTVASIVDEIKDKKALNQKGEKVKLNPFTEIWGEILAEILQSGKIKASVDKVAVKYDSPAPELVRELAKTPIENFWLDPNNIYATLKAMKQKGVDYKLGSQLLLNVGYPPSMVLQAMNRLEREIRENQYLDIRKRIKHSGRKQSKVSTDGKPKGAIKTLKVEGKQLTNKIKSLLKKKRAEQPVKKETPGISTQPNEVKLDDVSKKEKQLESENGNSEKELLEKANENLKKKVDKLEYRLARQKRIEQIAKKLSKKTNKNAEELEKLLCDMDEQGVEKIAFIHSVDTASKKKVNPTDSIIASLVDDKKLVPPMIPLDADIDYDEMDGDDRLTKLSQAFLQDDKLK